MTCDVNLAHFEKFNCFHSGHLIVNEDRKILFCNAYVTELTGFSVQVLIDNPISSLFTKASNIFIDSYVYPLLLKDKIVEEIQIKLTKSDNESVPIVINIIEDNKGLSYWSFYVCANRDKLQTELLKAKKELENKASELYNLATTDPLTGLLNRRELAVLGNKLINHANSDHSNLAMLCIDVDYFKRVNDAHGHQVGDQVLQNLAALLLENRHTDDLVDRVGGEEFIILLGDITLENAHKITEDLRIKIAKHILSGVNITVSIGLVVSSKNQIVDYQSLHSIADNALYASKQNGRNRTTAVSYQI